MGPKPDVSRTLVRASAEETRETDVMTPANHISLLKSDKMTADNWIVGRVFEERASGGALTNVEHMFSLHSLVVGRIASDQ